MVDVMVDAAELIGTQGFRHQLNGKALTLSWRTDRVSPSSLETLETKLQAILGK